MIYGMSALGPSWKTEGLDVPQDLLVWGQGTLDPRQRSLAGSESAEWVNPPVASYIVSC